MPKCGSSSVNKVIIDLTDENDFDMHGINDNHALDDKEIQDLIRKMQSLKTQQYKLVWSSHIYYVDFKKFNFNPILMNVVRDPVQRMISKEMPILL